MPFGLDLEGIEDAEIVTGSGTPESRRGGAGRIVLFSVLALLATTAAAFAPEYFGLRGPLHDDPIEDLKQFKLRPRGD